MWQQEDLIVQALEDWGTFYRASLPEETEIGFSGVYSKDGEPVIAVANTRTVDASISVAVSSRLANDSRSIRPPFEKPVDVYLDSAFLGSTGWSTDNDGDWAASVRATPGAWLEISTKGRWGSPPATIELVRDRPALDNGQQAPKSEGPQGWTKRG